MEKALEADDWKEGIKIYWGENVRHKDKMERCMKEIEKLRFSKNRFVIKFKSIFILNNSTSVKRFYH